MTTTPAHHHERWQIRKDPTGQRYCAACGDQVGPEVIPACCAMPFDSREGKRYNCLTCGRTYMVINGQWTLTDPIVDLTEFPQSVHDDLRNPYDLTTDERTL